MGKVTGFMEYERETPQTRPVAERVRDWRELYNAFPMDALQRQAARCMDCGVPFCHNGCSLHNLIPVWNDWVYKGRWEEAVEALHETNNFPEFTGRVCPAPCEAACVVGINREPVTIRQVELTIAEEGFKRGLLKPQPPQTKTGKKAAVIGSGPAGMAAAQQLARAGHDVVLFEKHAKAGGMLRYGIPDFKLEKWVIDRRLEQMAGEGVTIRAGVHVGQDVDTKTLQDEFDAIILTGGAEQPRDLPISGRELGGVHFAMDYLTQQNRRVGGEALGEEEREIHAKGKQVVVIGGGDTGSDCVGTAIRQGAAKVTQLELMPKPPAQRHPTTPWPVWPIKLQTSTSHQEGCERAWSVQTTAFEGDDGWVRRLRAVRIAWEEREGGRPPKMRRIKGSKFFLDADLVLLAMGFVHPVKSGMLEQLGVDLDERGNVRINQAGMTSVPGVFSAGDMATGQSLVLRAIKGGREAAESADTWLREQ